MLIADLALSLAACALIIWLFVLATRRYGIWADVQAAVVAIFALVLFLLTVIFMGVAFAQPLQPNCNMAVAWLLASDTALLAGVAMLASLAWQRRQGAFSCLLLLIGPVGIVIFGALMLGSLAMLDSLSPGCWS